MNLRITDLLDDYMDEQLYMDPAAVPDTKRIKEAAMKRIHRKKITRPVRVALIAAAIVVVLTGTVLAVIHYSGITDAMEQKWNASGSTEMTQEQKDFIEQRSADIGESVTDQGITVTIDSVTCTGTTVNILYSVELDPEVYDLDRIESCADALTPIYVENEDYGTVRKSRGGSNGEPEENGVVWRESQVEFSDLPEGANLGDGKTTLHMEMNTFWISATDAEDTLPDVTGTWNFAFLLPQVEATEAQTSDEVLNFENGVTLELSDITVEASGCKFAVQTETDEYFFTAGGENAALARAAEPDLLAFTVDALMADGTTVPSDGGGMSYDAEQDADLWSIDWTAPLDPADVVSLIFSDGTTEIEVPMNS